jgi:hypothetical protein
MGAAKGTTVVISAIDFDVGGVDQARPTSTAHSLNDGTRATAGTGSS